ncbi:Hint domain-containing protein, partial [Asaia bogorensis]|uniref:Hint domain-containing protein n=1 Tax=Asaia bogorensis TaxID=91915 RepID=UPI0013CE924B
LTGLNNTIYVLSGGVLKDSKIENGLVDVAAGASTHGNTLNSTITNYYSGATSRDDTWFNSGFDYNWATFASGAMVTGAQALSGGYIQLQAGASGTDIHAVNGGSAVFADGTAESFTAANGGYVQSGAAVYSGMVLNGQAHDNATVLNGIWSAVSIDGVTVYKSNSLTAQWPVVLGTGATLYVMSGAVASGLTGLNNAVYIQPGGSMAGSKLDNGSVVVSAGALTRDNQLNSTAVYYQSGAASENDTWYNSGYDYNWATFVSGASVTGAHVLSGGYLEVQAGATASNVYAVSGGSAILASGTTSGFTATGGGYVQSGTAVYSGAVINNQFHDNAPVLNGVWSAVSLDGSTSYTSNGVTLQWPVALGTGSVLYVFSGAVASGLTGLNNAVYIQSGGTLAGSRLDNGAIVVSSGAVTQDNLLNSTATSYEAGGASINDTLFNSGYDNNWAIFYSGASVTGTQVSSGAYLKVEYGAHASDLLVAGGGSAILLSDTTNGYTAGQGGYVQSGNAYYSGMTINGESYDNVQLLYGVWSAVNVNGATVYQSNGTTMQWPVALGNGAVLHVESGAVASGISGNAVAIYVSNGGTLAYSHIVEGGVTVLSGGVTSSNEFNSIPTVIYSGASSVDDTWFNSGYCNDGVAVYSGASITNVTVGNGAFMNIDYGVHIGGDVHVSSAGTLVTYSPFGHDVPTPVAPPPSDGTVLRGVWSAVPLDGTTVYQSNGVTVSAPVSVADGAVIYVQSGAVASNLSGYAVAIYVSYGGTLAHSYIREGSVTVFGGGLTSANQFNSIPTALYSGARSVDDTWFNSGYCNDFALVYSGAVVNNPSIGSGGVISGAPGAVITTPAVANGGVLMANNTEMDPCFLAGSMIRTDKGDVAVEDLLVGDMVACLVEGETVFRPVRWIGSQQNQLRPFEPLDLAGYPVRICAGAFGEALPYEDLLVTPEHCMHFDGHFVPVRMLVNGTSIYYDQSRPIYHYYHIELDPHSIILANGLETESYLDTGNKAHFDRQKGAEGVVLGQRRTWHDDAAAKLETGRAFVEPIYRRFETRANGMPRVGLASHEQVVSHDPALRLTTLDGRTFNPIRRSGDIYTFLVPGGVTDMRIISRTGRPCDVVGPFLDDRRALGVRIGKITLFMSGATAANDDHLLIPSLEGWHGLEASGSRWTDGMAVLRLENGHCSDMSLISIEVLETAGYLEGNSWAEQRSA